MELTYGAEFGDEEERRSVRNALRMYPVVEQEETIAHRAGQLLTRADQKAGGESGIDEFDPMIGAVSDIYDEPALTTTVVNFESLGVETEYVVAVGSIYTVRDDGRSGDSDREHLSYPGRRDRRPPLPVGCTPLDQVCALASSSQSGSSTVVEPTPVSEYSHDPLTSVPSSVRPE